MTVQKAILSLLISVLMCSCLSYPESAFNPVILDEHSIESIEGNYEFRPYQIEINDADKFTPMQSFEEILNRTILREPSECYSNHGRTFELSLQEEKLNISWQNNGAETCKTSFKMKLDSEGYIRIKNKNSKIVLIPYLLGGVDVTKVRLTINEDGDLVCDVINHRSGAAFFIVFLSWNTWKYRLIYKRKR